MKTNSWYESVGLVEENHTCNQCGYFYEFVYGNYTEIVNRREFIWNYKCNGNKESYEAFNKLLNKNIKRHKVKWKMFGYSCYKKEPIYTYMCSDVKDKGKKIEKIRGGV